MKARLQTVTRIALAAVFIVAALPKIAAPRDFALALFRYRLLPDAAINAAALTIPWMEALAALALLSPRWRTVGAAWLLALLGGATFALAAALARGLEIDCGCFGLKPGGSPITLWSLARNMALLAAVAWSALRMRNAERGTRNAGSRPTSELRPPTSDR